MSTDGPPDASTVQQFGAAIGLGLAAAIGAVWQWIRGNRGGGEKKGRIIIDAFEVADMSPVRETAAVLREAREIVPLIRETIRILQEMAPRLAEENKLLIDLHAKRDRGDVVVGDMQEEFRGTLREILQILQKIDTTIYMEVEIKRRIAHERDRERD